MGNRGGKQKLLSTYCIYLILCRWTWRQRIRTVLIGRYSKTTVELCDPQLRVPNTQFETYPPQVMSALALNEVFIAELLAGR